MTGSSRIQHSAVNRQEAGLSQFLSYIFRHLQHLSNTIVWYGYHGLLALHRSFGRKAIFYWETVANKVPLNCLGLGVDRLVEAGPSSRRAATPSWLGDYRGQIRCCSPSPRKLRERQLRLGCLTSCPLPRLVQVRAMELAVIQSHEVLAQWMKYSCAAARHSTFAGCDLPGNGFIAVLQRGLYQEDPCNICSSLKDMLFGRYGSAHL